MLQLQIQFWSQYNQSNYFKVIFKLNKYDKYVQTCTHETFLVQFVTGFVC